MTQTKTEAPETQKIMVAIMGFSVHAGPGGLPWSCKVGARLPADHEIVKLHPTWFVEDGADDATIGRATHAAYGTGDEGGEAA